MSEARMRCALAALALLVVMAPAVAQELPPPGPDLGDGLAVSAGSSVQLDRSARVFGDVHSNGGVTLAKMSEVDGDVTLGGAFTGSVGAVTGSVTQVALRELPPIPTEADARALADRVFEADTELSDTAIDDVVFVAGTATLSGAISGAGTVIASGDIVVEPLDILISTPENHPLRLSLIAFQDVAILENPQMRGTVLAGGNVALAANVSLRGTVTAHGSVTAGTGSTVTFEAFDETPPTVSDLAPADGAFVATASVEISVRFTDDASGVSPSSVVLKVDGADRTSEASVSGQGLVLPASEGLSDGTHTVELSLADFAGNSTAVSWSFVVDTVPPALAFTEPVEPVILNDPVPRIVLAFSDGTSGVDPATLELVLDGAAIEDHCFLTPTDAFCSPPELPPAVHSANAAIGDRAGNTATAERTFETRNDLTGPEITITSPADGSLLGAGLVQVTGTAMDDGELVSVQVNGQPAALDGESFSATVELAEGTALVQAVAEDSTGKEGFAAVVVTVDTTAPAVTIEAPEDGALSNIGTVLVSGRVTDDSPISSLTVAGEASALTGERFEREVALGAGQNVIVVQAIDAAGHLGEAEVEVRRFELPEVRITAPEDLATIAATTVRVQGAIGDPAGEVEVNGVAATVFSDGAFLVESVPLIEGGNVLTATVTASDGAVNTASIHVVRDLTAPRVAITTPADGSTVHTATVAVSGLVNDIVAGTVNAQEATVTVNGVAATVRNRSFLATGVPLAIGDNMLTVTATDESGNVGQATARVVREDPAGQARIEAAGGDLQQGPALSLLAEPLQVVVRGAGGSSLAGRTVVFEEAGGGGTLGQLDGGRRRIAVPTDAAGVAAAHWNLGRRAGVQRVRATAVGLPGAVTFTALATTMEPAFLVVDAGGQQVGTAGRQLPRPFIATVTDAGFNRLGGVPVEWTVVKGDGHFANGESSMIVETDSDGRAIATLVLDPAEGVANNAVTARIAGLPESPVASFTASGRAAGPAAATAVTGVVLDNTSRPVAGVTVRIDGTTLLTTTDAAGQFRIDGAPVGEVELNVDGSTAERPGVWASLAFRLTTIPGRDNDLGMPIFLLPLDVVGGLYVDETTGGVVTVPEVPGLTLEVKPGTVTFPGGSKSGVVSMTVVHSDRIPMVPNFGQQPRLIVTIQPTGARFDPPARITYPNIEGLAPGETTDLYSFDHDLGHFVSIGPGTVTDDGTLLVSDPGVGILKAGWHCGGDPQGATGTPHDCPDCHECNTETDICEPDDSLTCADQDGCTADDRCSGGRCVGDTIFISGVDATGNGQKSVEEVTEVEIQFSAGAAIQTNCEAPLEYHWNFGDGSSSQERNPIHAYEEEGTYTAHLTVKCPTCAKATKSDTVAVTVTCPDVEIVAADPDVSYICPGCEVQYTAETDPPGRAVYWKIPPFGGLGGKATISSTGLLSIAADAPAGVVAVQASARPEGSECSDTRTVRVFAPPNEELNSDNRTPGEEAWILNNKWCAFWEVSNLKKECKSMTDSHIGTPLDGTKENAWEHAYCNCVTASRCGVPAAQDLWDAHEDYKGNPCTHASMDLHNNEVGRQAATEDESLCVALVDEALDDGQLRWLNPPSSVGCPVFDNF